MSSQTGNPPSQADLDRQMLDVNRAIDGNPQDSKAYRDRGWIYAHKRELDRALADLDMAVVGLRKSASRLSLGLVAFIGALLLVTLDAFAAASPRFPEATGRVIDEAKLLSEEDERELVANLKGVESATFPTLFVVVTLPSLQSLQGHSIEDYSYQLSKHWGMSTKGVLLLIVAEYQPRVRIEIGQDLKTILTDKIVKSIIEEDILPSFRKGYYAEGIKDGVNAMFAVLTFTPPSPPFEGAAGWYDDKDVWHWASGPRPTDHCPLDRTVFKDAKSGREFIAQRVAVDYMYLCDGKASRRYSRPQKKLDGECSGPFGETIVEGLLDGDRAYATYIVEKAVPCCTVYSYRGDDPQVLRKVKEWLRPEEVPLIEPGFEEEYTIGGPPNPPFDPDQGPMGGGKFEPTSCRSG